MKFGVLKSEIEFLFFFLQIKGTDALNASELHISYHNGDHYSSVRKAGDISNQPASIKLKVSTYISCESSFLNYVRMFSLIVSTVGPCQGTVFLKFDLNYNPDSLLHLFVLFSL